MDSAQLRKLLAQQDIRPDAFDLDGKDCDECLRLERRQNRWVVYYAERGLRTGERFFPTEDEACRYMAVTLTDDPGAKRVFPRYPGDSKN